MECRKEDNLKFCNCGFDCERKGICCLCLANHRDKGQLPACYFTDIVASSHDRSIETYLMKFERSKRGGDYTSRKIPVATI